MAGRPVSWFQEQVFVVVVVCLFLITVWLTLCGLRLVEFVRGGRGGTES